MTNHADTEQLLDVATGFGIDISDIPIPNEDDDNQPASLDGPPWTDSTPGGIEFWGAPSVHDLLQHDPSSPHLQFVAAKEAIAKQQLAEAEAHLRVSLSSLPEYSDALALLAQIYRQQRDHRRTAEMLMEAITSPRCFGAWDRKKLINWLQRLDDHACDGCDDPLWARRKELTFVEGVKENADYRIIEELIDEYHRLGMGVRAVRLRVLAGEMMGRETVSFRERSNWSGSTFRSQLKSDLEHAGLLGRLASVEFSESPHMRAKKKDTNNPESEEIKYLNQLAERITILHAELFHSGADEAGDVFQGKFRTLHRLKEEYKRLTGIYPNLPPYE
jgi:tetratricopeptide (TPR) repeat protein